VARTSKPQWDVLEDPEGEAELLAINGQLVAATPTGGPITFQMGLDPWERQPAESDKDWAYFAFYRDTPAFDRTIKNTYLHFFPEPAIAGVTDKPVMHWLYDIAQRFGWKERVTEHDRYQDEFFRGALLAERVKARKETAVLGTDMRRKAAEALKYVQTVLTYEVMDPVTGEVSVETKTVLTIKEILDLAKVGADLEQGALDMKQEGIIAQQVHVHIKDNDNQLLEAAKTLLQARDMIDVTPSQGGKE